MAQSYFVWKGTDSRNMGIIMRQAAPIIRPEERVQHVTIPGMSGDLTEIEGENIYNSYIQTVEISVKSAASVPAVYKWLRGSGYVTFSGEPARRQQARVIGAVTLQKVSRNMDHWAGTVQFYCQPLKESIPDGASILTGAGTVPNNGDVASYPLIIVTPSSTTVTLTVNGKSLVLTNASGTRRVDCLAKVISNSGQTALYTQYSAGTFPVLNVGDNTFGGSGWSRLTIYRRERYL